jgi:16S rRNA (cytosine967-C5)-methyltransferase
MARDAAARVLSRVIDEGAYSQRALHAELQGTTLETRDRGFCTVLVYGTLTYLRPIDAALDRRLKQGLGSTPPLVRAALRIACYQLGWMRETIPAFAAIDEAVSSVRRLAGNRFVTITNGVLRNLERDGIDAIRGTNDALPERRFAMQYGLTDELARMLVSRLGEERAAAVMSAYNAPTPVHARVRRGTVDDAIAALATEGIKAVAHAQVPGSIVCSGGNVASSEAARTGLLAVQDAGAQLPVARAAALLNGANSPKILDVCAGVGVKSLQLADVLHPEPLVCTDRDARKLGALRTALEGVENVVAVAWDAANKPAPPEVVDNGPYDVVLIDAPCTALGTMGRHPEVRFRFRPAAVAELAAVQARIVERVAEQVREGGWLIYVVCTFTREETTAQVRRLVDGGGFVPVPSVEDTDVDAFGGQWLWPDRSATDGFYIACLQRTASTKEER